FRGASWHRLAPADPGPLVRDGVELPKVVKNAKSRADGIVPKATKKPEIAVLVGPGCPLVAASGDVSGSGRSQRAIDSRLTILSVGDCAASAHPCPITNSAR